MRVCTCILANRDRVTCVDCAYVYTVMCTVRAINCSIINKYIDIYIYRDI